MQKPWQITVSKLAKRKLHVDTDVYNRGLRRSDSFATRQVAI